MPQNAVIRPPSTMNTWTHGQANARPVARIVVRSWPLIYGARQLAKPRFRIYINLVRITCDQVKRDKTLAERGLDFADAGIVFAGTTVEVVDDRKDYGERRVICYGLGQR